MSPKKPLRGPLKYLLIAVGWLAVALGVAGIFLPLLPTTPFLLLAAYCFSRTSERFHHWLITHPRLGPPVLDWQKYGVIRRRVKWLATVLMILTYSTSAYVMHEKTHVIIVLSITIVSVMTFIWSRPSNPRSESKSPSF